MNPLSATERQDLTLSRGTGSAGTHRRNGGARGECLRVPLVSGFASPPRSSLPVVTVAGRHPDHPTLAGATGWRVGPIFTFLRGSRCRRAGRFGSLMRSYGSAWFHDVRLSARYAAEGAA
jgi:hypothetical protein